MNKEELKQYSEFDEIDMSDIRCYLFTRKEISEKLSKSHSSNPLYKEMENSIVYINSRLKEIIHFDEA